MIRYDWLVLRKLPIKITLRILYALTDRKTMKDSSKSVLESISRFSDTSPYLLNPMGLIMNKGSHSDDEIYLYLELAALRSYSNYEETGEKSLTTNYIKERYDLFQISLNTALDVREEGKIIFKYEEL